MARTLTTAPMRAIVDGNWQLGTYNTPLKQANLLDAKPYALPVPTFIKNLQLREWQAFQICNAEYFIMVAIYNTKKIALGQFIVYNRLTHEKFRYEKKSLANSITIPDTLYGNTVATYTSDNFKLKATHDLDHNKLSLEVDIQNFEKLPNVKASFSGEHDTKRYVPSVVVMPFDDRKGMYSHKCLMPLSGQVQLGTQTISFTPEQSQLILDDHKGYYPYPTRYDWLTGFGRNAAGELIGFNLTDNQVRNKDHYNENVLWLNGQITPLPAVQFERPKGVREPWRVRDKSGSVNLIFTPEVHTSVNLNLGLIASYYEGPYGRVSGSIADTDMSACFAMGEEFYLRT